MTTVLTNISQMTPAPQDQTRLGQDKFFPATAIELQALAVPTFVSGAITNATTFSSSLTAGAAYGLTAIGNGAWVTLNGNTPVSSSGTGSNQAMYVASGVPAITFVARSGSTTLIASGDGAGKLLLWNASSVKL